MNLARHRLEEKELPLPRRVALMARSFVLQSAWSFERMQSIGFAALMAGVRKGLEVLFAPAPKQLDRAYTDEDMFIG